MPDVVRDMGLGWSLHHRNQLGITLDIPSPEGRHRFSQLLRRADIWVESSKAGTYDDWGFDDEAVFALNPRLVIVHVTTYGQQGLSEYTKRPGYDGMAQAFGGYMHWNGMPDPAPPLRAKPMTADAVTAVYGAMAALAALHRACETGIGESIDLAQYEVLLRIQGSALVQALNRAPQDEVQPVRYGNGDPQWLIHDCYRCGDGEWLTVMIVGASGWRHAAAFLGFEGDPDFPAQPYSRLRRGSPAGDKADRAVAEFCAQRSAQDAERELSAARIACARVLGPDDMATHPHYVARESLSEWADHTSGRTVLGPSVVPKFRNRPGRIWRGGFDYGEDNEQVFAELDAQDGLISPDEREHSWH